MELDKCDKDVIGLYVEGHPSGPDAWHIIEIIENGNAGTPRNTHSGAALEIVLEAREMVNGTGQV